MNQTSTFGDVGRVECVELSDHEGPVQSVSWRSSGSTLASTCKDKQLRVFDVRAATVAQVISYSDILIQTELRNIKCSDMFVILTVKQ